MNQKIKSEAIKNLVSGNYHMNADYSIEYMSGQTPPTEEAIQTEVDRLETRDNAQAYARNRKAEYPDWGSQLNKIYDDGVTKWKAEMVDPIKAKWPKDNSGPV